MAEIEMISFQWKNVHDYGGKQESEQYVLSALFMHTVFTHHLVTKISSIFVFTSKHYSV